MPSAGDRGRWEGRGVAKLRWVFLNEGTAPWVRWLERHGIDPSTIEPFTVLLCDDDAREIVYDRVLAGGVGGWRTVEQVVQLEAAALDFPDPDGVNPST